MDQPKPKLLFVEDEALVRIVIVEDLVDAGFAVSEAASGAEALRLLSQGLKADLLFTDIRMPGEMDGWELALRARTLMPTLPVIYATGYTEDVERMVQGSRLMKKPYTIDTFVALAREVGVSLE